MLIFAGVIAACTADIKSMQNEATSTIEEEMGLIKVTVDRVVDGDTVDFIKDGEVVRVRLIGIDAPEIGEPGGTEATAFLADLLPEGDYAYLDIGDPAEDRFGRTRAYVWLAWQDTGTSSSSMANEILLRAGHARVLTINPEGWEGLFETSEEEARDAGRGIWGLE